MILNLTNREGCYFFSFITLITYASIQLIFARNLSDWFGLLFILFPCLLLLRAAYTKDKECIKISYLAFCIIGIPFIAFMIFINFIWRSRSSLLSLFFFPVVLYYIYGLWIIFSHYHELEGEELVKQLTLKEVDKHEDINAPNAPEIDQNFTKKEN